MYKQYTRIKKRGETKALLLPIHSAYNFVDITF